jgi:hypothetical protein
MKPRAKFYEPVTKRYLVTKLQELQDKLDAIEELHSMETKEGYNLVLTCKECGSDTYPCNTLDIIYRKRS